MTDDERILFASMTLLVVRWQHEDERQTCLGLIEEILPDVIADGWLAVTEAGRDMVAARNDFEWSCATRAAGLALVPKLQSILTQAVIRRTAALARISAA